MIALADDHISGFADELVAIPTALSGSQGNTASRRLDEMLPDNAATFEAAVRLGFVQVGRVFLQARAYELPRYVANLPLCCQWEFMISLRAFRRCLKHLASELLTLPVRSVAVAIPEDDFGKLTWNHVAADIEHELRRVPQSISVYRFRAGPSIQE